MHSFDRWSLAVIVCFLLICLIALSQTPTSVFWSPDEGGKFIQLLTLLRWKDGRPDKIPYLGQRLDPDYKFYPPRFFPQPTDNGQVHFWWSLWFPAMSIAPFKLLGTPGLYLIPVISGWLIVILSGWLAHRLISAATPLTVVAVGLASPVFFYSLLFWEHTLTVLIGLAASWQAMRVSQAKGWRKWLALGLTGALLAIAVALRLEMLIYVLALVLASSFAIIVHHRNRPALLKRSGLLLVAVVISIALPFIFSNLFNLPGESWLEPSGFIHQIRSVHWFIERALSLVKDVNFWINFPSTVREIWINPLFRETDPGPEIPSALTWLGLAGVILGGLAIVIPKRAQFWLLGGASLLVGLVSAYALLSPQHYRIIDSIFLPAPYLVFAFLFLAYAYRERCFEATLLAATTILYLVLGTVAMSFFWGPPDPNVGRPELGLAWGSRYLLIIYPLAGICAVVGLHHFYQATSSYWHKRLLLGLVAPLLILAVSYQIRGVREVQVTKENLAAYSEALAATHQPVVTDLFWLPASLATRFAQQEMYTLAQRDDLYAWLELAEGQVETFVFASFSPLDLDKEFIQAAPYPIVPRGRQVVQGMSLVEFSVAEY